jgi:hypothetical protein
MRESEAAAASDKVAPGMLGEESGTSAMKAALAGNSSAKPAEQSKVLGLPLTRSVSGWSIAAI